MPNPCWARSLGDCAGRLSREHTVSRVVLDDEQIEFTGPVTQGQPRVIGIAALCSKILCEKHNNALSPLDDAAGVFRAAMDECVRLASVRRSLSPRKDWTLACFDVDGPLIERWFLKTLINVEQTFPTNDASWVAGAVDREPPAELVRIVYGRSAFPQDAGLHAIIYEGLNEHFRRTVQITVMVDQRDDTICAGAFTFQGLRLVLTLRPIAPGQPFTVDGVTPANAGPGRTILRPNKFWFRVHGAKSQVIRFNWGALQHTREPLSTDIR